MFEGKVVIIGPLPPPAGGIALWTQDYVAYSKTNGIKIEVIDTSLVGERATNSGSRRILRDEIKRCFSIWMGILKKAKKKNTHVVHMNVNCSPLGVKRDYISAIVLKLKRIPFVVHCHCNIEDQIGRGKVSQWLLRQIFFLASDIIVLNSSSHDYVYKATGKDSNIIANFVQMNQFKSDKQIHREIENVVYVGHIRKAKGIDELLEVARLNDKIQFILIGPVTDDYDEREILKSSKGNVKITGSLNTSDVNKYLDLADVFVLPSYSEGFSRALLEAMARGVPCIATDVGSSIDMLEKSGGVIIHSHSVEQLREAIDFLQDYDVRCHMSEWNYNKSFSLYSIEKVTRSIWDIYNKISVKK